jgi:hypothetical protein
MIVDDVDGNCGLKQQKQANRKMVVEWDIHGISWNSMGFNGIY